MWGGNMTRFPSTPFPPDQTQIPFTNALLARDPLRTLLQGFEKSSHIAGLLLR